MEVEFWEADNGRAPAGEFLEELEPKTKKRAIWLIEQLEAHGLNLLQSGHLKKLSGYDLYELRVSSDKQCRLFGVIRHPKFWILHGFIKKSPETPRREIKTALNRSKELDIQLGSAK